MEPVMLALELIGTCAFAVSGAVAAMNKRLDLFGVVFCGIVTALGGGIIRDILLCNLPPVMFSNYIYLIVAVVTCFAAFVAGRVYREAFAEKIPRIDQINNIFDAIGLGVFTIVGINTACSVGYGGNAFFAIFLGMTTGCGGGILRDIIVREVPLVLSKRVYAVASIVGGLVYYHLFQIWGLPEIVSVLCGVACVFIVRILATVFRWDLPRAF